MAKISDKILNGKEPIKIGNISVMSGEYAFYGNWEKNGVDLAAEELNGRGGINGRLFEIIREDDQADPVRSMEAISKLIHVDKVYAIIGPMSSDNLVADAPFAAKNKTVLLSAGASVAAVPDGRGYIFQIFPITSQIGKRLVEAAAQRGSKTAAIIYINNSYGVDLAKTIRREAPLAGIEIMAVEGYRPDNENFAGQLARIKEKNPRAVFILGYPREMGLILKQAQKNSLKADFFAPDTFAAPAIKSVAGTAAEGIIYIMPSDTFTPEFVGNFKKKYGHAPNYIEGLSYDAFNLLALAIGRGGHDGAKVRDILLGIKDYQGVSGIITFDEHGNAINRPLALRTVMEGREVHLPK